MTGADVGRRRDLLDPNDRPEAFGPCHEPCDRRGRDHLQPATDDVDEVGRLARVVF
jgi:hypothetical protein